MFSDQRNLILAIVVSLSILLAFEFLYNSPRLQKETARQQAIEQSLPKPAAQPTRGRLMARPRCGREPERRNRQYGHRSTRSSSAPNNFNKRVASRSSPRSSREL